MKIDVVDSSSKIVVNVEGIIKTSENAQSFIDAVGSAISKNSNVDIIIKDSFSVTSTIIGFLMQKVNVDRANLAIKVGNDRLYELFSMLGVSSILKVQKI